MTDQTICPVCGSDKLDITVSDCECGDCMATWCEDMRTALTLTRAEVEEKIKEVETNRRKYGDEIPEWNQYYAEEQLWRFLLGRF